MSERDFTSLTDLLKRLGAGSKGRKRSAREALDEAKKGKKR